jgi:hypothetical protein
MSRLFRKPNLTGPHIHPHMRKPRTRLMITAGMLPCDIICTVTPHRRLFVELNPEIDYVRRPSSLLARYVRNLTGTSLVSYLSS